MSISQASARTQPDVKRGKILHKILVYKDYK